MATTTELCLVSLVGVVLLRALGNALMSKPSAPRCRGSSVVFALLAFGLPASYYALFDGQPLWLTAMVALAAGGWLCVAVDCWRGSGRYTATRPNGAKGVK